MLKVGSCSSPHISDVKKEVPGTLATQSRELGNLVGAVMAMTWIFGLERLQGNQYTIKIRGCQVGEAGGVRKDWGRKECGKWKGPLSLRVSGNACGK